MPDILTIYDIMQRYDCTKSTAEKIMGQLPTFRIENTRFVKLRDLQNYEERIMQYPEGKVNTE